VLPDYYSPSNMGLLDPATSDGRLIVKLLCFTLVLPDYYSPSNMGLLDPATSDGRLIV
jgi:hypothetical protein